MCFGLRVCFTDVHFSWHAQKPHVVKHFFGVCHFDALGSVSVAITSSVSVFCLSRLAHGGCWNTLWCKWPMVEAWAILGGISHEHEQDLVLFKRTLWRHVRLEDHRLPLATHMHSLTVHYFDNVQYDDIALNSVVVSVFELQVAHLWTNYAATQSGWIFFSSVESLLWYSSFQPRVPTCASWIKKKKRKVTPRIKRSSNNLVQFALCAACLSQHDFTNAWVPHSHSFTPGTSRKRCNCLVFPHFPKFAGGKKHRLQPQQERSAVQWLWLHSRDQPLQQPCWSVLLRKHQGLQLGCGRSQNHDYCSRGQHQVRFSWKQGFVQKLDFSSSM